MSELNSDADVYDAIVISDTHLGSSMCLDRRLLRFLKTLPHTKRLIINGDLTETSERKLSSFQWLIWWTLYDLAKVTELVWVRGNHDPYTQDLAESLGARSVAFYEFTTGESRCLCIHGHQWDDFLDSHPKLTKLGDIIYYTLQMIDPSHKLACWAKRNTKAFMHCVEKVRRGSIELARHSGCQIVCTGHTHHAEIGKDVSPADGGVVQFVNSGCWTEQPGSYLTVKDGVVELRYFED